VVVIVTYVVVVGEEEGEGEEEEGEEEGEEEEGEEVVVVVEVVVVEVVVVEVVDEVVVELAHVVASRSEVGGERCGRVDDAGASFRGRAVPGPL
jgi:hypothetical protein